MNVNNKKSNIVHFRQNSTPITDYVFTCGTDTLSIVNKYTYLGLVLNEHLDLDVMVRAVAQSASRALGLVIANQM